MAGRGVMATARRRRRAARCQWLSEALTAARVDGVLRSRLACSHQCRDRLVCRQASHNHGCVAWNVAKRREQAELAGCKDTSNNGAARKKVVALLSPVQTCTRHGIGYPTPQPAHCKLLGRLPILCGRIRPHFSRSRRQRLHTTFRALGAAAAPIARRRRAPQSRQPPPHRRYYTQNAAAAHQERPEGTFPTRQHPTETARAPPPS